MTISNDFPAELLRRATDATIQKHAESRVHISRSWARVSRHLGHAFHAIVGSHFADAGRLADGFMESGLIGLVKRFRDAAPASQAFP